MGCHILLQGIFPTQGWNSGACPTLQVGSLPSEPLRKPIYIFQNAANHTTLQRGWLLCSVYNQKHLILKKLFQTHSSCLLFFSHMVLFSHNYFLPSPLPILSHLTNLIPPQHFAFILACLQSLLFIDIDIIILGYKETTGNVSRLDHFSPSPWPSP